MILIKELTEIVLRTLFNVFKPIFNHRSFWNVRLIFGSSLSLIHFQLQWVCELNRKFCCHSDGSVCSLCVRVCLNPSIFEWNAISHPTSFRLQSFLLPKHVCLINWMSSSFQPNRLHRVFSLKQLEIISQNALNNTTAQFSEVGFVRNEVIEKEEWATKITSIIPVYYVRRCQLRHETKSSRVTNNQKVKRET